MRTLPSLALLASLLCLPAAALAGQCSLAKIADLPAIMRDHQPVVSATINGQAVSFIADSGAFYSMLTPATAAELHLHLEAAPFGYYITGIGGENEVSVTTVREFGLAGATIPRVQFLVGGNSFGGESAGLLGQNVLHLGDVEYDLANGVIRLWKPKDCGDKLMAYWVKPGENWSVVPIHGADPNDKHAVGEAFVNGVKIRVIFDTGANHSTLTRTAARRIGLNLDGPDVTPGGMSGGVGRRMVNSWIVPVATFKIGDEEISHTHLRVSDSSSADIETDMLLGADFFLSHRIYVSNAYHKLYFTYGGGPVFDLKVASASEMAAAPAAIDPGPDAKPDPRANTPTDAEGFARRGEGFAARGDYVRAIADLTQAVTLAPQNSQYLSRRAQAYLANRQLFLAMADYDHALGLTPDDVPTLLARAALRLGGHDRPGALADLEAADHAAAREADARFLIGALYERAEAFPQAIAQYDLWLKTHPDDSGRPRTLNARAWARAMAGQDLTAALDDCNSALHGAPKAPSFLDTRGLVRLRLGQYDEAIADYDAALALNPKLAWSLYGRGLAKLHKGLAAEGNADIAAATALQPGLPARAKDRGIVAP